MKKKTGPGHDSNDKYTLLNGSGSKVGWQFHSMFQHVWRSGSCSSASRVLTRFSPDLMGIWRHKIHRKSSSENTHLICFQRKLLKIGERRFKDHPSYEYKKHTKSCVPPKYHNTLYRLLILRQCCVLQIQFTWSHCNQKWTFLFHLDSTFCSQRTSVCKYW